MKNHKWLPALFCFLTLGGYAQKIATFEVELRHPTYELRIPASINLDAVTFIAADSLSLTVVKNGENIPVPFQVEVAGHRTLHWTIKPANKRQRKFVFELAKGAPAAPAKIKTADSDGALTIYSGNQNLLRYHYKTVYPPAGIDSVYKRSGFIHPLWSPHGQILTDIQPADHYHHYGIWNPWTHVLYEGDTVDFWNLAKRQGTVRFANFVSVSSGAVYSEYEALHEHVVFKKSGGEKVALKELQRVKVYRPDEVEDYYIVDLTLKMNCADASPFRILEYRYGGLGWRATEKWNKDNSEILSSTGKTRKNVDGSRERWCMIQGDFDDGHAGIVMMSYPANYSHPEPMRIWPDGPNDHEEVFVNFAPTKYRDWLLKPGKNYVLKYRLVVFNGEFSKEKAESAWQYFAHPPKVTVRK